MSNCCRAPAIGADELMEYAARQLTSYKRPCEIILLDALPAASTGKILKHKLWEAAARREGAGLTRRRRLCLCGHGVTLMTPASNCDAAFW